MNEFSKVWKLSVYEWGWIINGDNCRICKENLDDFHTTRKRQLADAHLIATAGTTATKLAEQGYDAVKALELMPKIMHSLEQSSEFRYHAGMEIEDIKHGEGHE